MFDRATGAFKVEQEDPITDDPNKRQNDPKQTDEPASQQHGQHFGQQQRNAGESSRKRPSQGVTNQEQDQERQDQSGQRRAS